MKLFGFVTTDSSHQDSLTIENNERLLFIKEIDFICFLHSKSEHYTLESVSVSVRSRPVFFSKSVPIPDLDPRDESRTAHL